MRLGVSLDFRARDTSRLWETLELSDEQLISALGGRKREELGRWHASAASRSPQSAAGEVEQVCRHEDGYPSTLRHDPLAPHELHVAGGLGRLQELLGAPAVAIVGARRCTDYGMEVARCLGRDLAAAGVCVIGELCDGVGYGAQLGATGGRRGKRRGGGWRARRLLPSLLCIPVPTCDSHRVRDLRAAPRGTGTRLVCRRPVAHRRTAPDHAHVTGPTAEQDSSELACARLASARGRTIAAVPGRVTSPPSHGTNGLLKEGVALVRDAGDVLDLLYGASSPDASSGTWSEEPRIEQRLQALLRRIGEGKDTISKLGAEHWQPDVALRELAELELRGLVRRGDGGRYVPRAVTFCG